MEIKFETNYEGLIKLVEHLHGEKNNIGEEIPQHVFYLKEVKPKVETVGVGRYNVHIDTVKEFPKKKFEIYLENLTDLLKQMLLH